MKEALYYRESGSVFFLKAVGHVTANDCSNLRDLVTLCLNNPPTKENFFVDLADCDYMDSTFMGLLVRFNKDLKVKGQKSLTIVNVSEQCDKLLKGLGLHKILTFENRQDMPMLGIMTVVNKDRLPETSVVLTAHEELSNLSPENKARFGALNEILRRQMEEEKK